MTKILATLPLLMELEEHKMFVLESSLGSLVPRLKHSNKKDLTVKEVLSHYGRLQAWIPFYTVTLDSHKKPSSKYYKTNDTLNFNSIVDPNLYIRKDYKDTIYNIIAKSELYEKKGYKYSDLSYYIFKEYIEDYYKKDLNVLTQSHFYQSIGADRTTYLPLEKSH